MKSGTINRHLSPSATARRVRLHLVENGDRIHRDGPHSWTSSSHLAAR